MIYTHKHDDVGGDILKRYIIYFYDVLGEEIERREFLTKKEAKRYAYLVAPLKFKFDKFRIRKF